MRYLVLNWRDIRSPEAGGAEVHLHEVFRRLVERGHHVTLLCSQFAARPGPAEEIVDGIRTIRVGAWWNAHLSVPRAARKLLRAEQFDLLVDDVNKIPFFAPAWSPIPVVAIFHHLLGGTVFRETNPLFASMIWLYERRVGRVYRDVPAIAVSRSTADELVMAGLHAGDVFVVPNGLDHGIHRRQDVPRDRDPLLVVLGRLKAYKRVDVAIRALAQIRHELPAARMVVIGEGGDRARLEGLAADLHQPVEFLGRVNDAEKVAWLSRAHLVVCPSSKEGFGLVALEAMACGTPNVVSDVAGHRDAVPDGVGVRVPVGDPAAFAAAAVRILRTPALHGELVERGLHFAANFTWDAAAQGVEHVARTALGEVRRRVPPSVPAAMSARWFSPQPEVSL